jgi:hypothetical protein
MAKADYDALEKEYVTGDMSIRALAAEHDVAWSSVAEQSRKRGWADKREAYRDSVQQRTYERAAAQFADQKSEIDNEMLLVMRATVRKYGELLLSGEVKPQAKDAVMAIEKILLITGNPTERREEKHLGINVSVPGGELGPEFLRRLLDTARARGTESRVLGSAERPRLEGAGED